ncbi:MAG: trimethylamine methyltransferase family protein [Desulfobacterales bacterium]|nr:trimethylamine methyltransferase family protein [Desulfobacterales bacterium]
MLNLRLGSGKIQEILHEKSLDILKNTGVVFNYPPALDLLKSRGAKIDGKTAFFPESLVLECLKTCPSQFTLSGVNGKNNAVFGKKDDFLVLPNLGPVFIQELDGTRRPGEMEDYINITRLSQNSPLVDVVGSCPIDVANADPETKFLQMIHQSARYSDKPIMCSTSTPVSMDRQMELMELIHGGPGIMKEKVITGTSLSPLSPLAYSEDAAYALMAFAGKGQMAIIAMAPMSGISAPVSITGTSLLINVEFLAGMVLAQCAGPGAPVVYATTASAGNMRSATYVTGIPDTTLLNNFAAQMGQYYSVPSRSVGSATDAKMPDMQAGYEAMQNLILIGLSGTSAVYETLGTLDALMSISYEKFMIDLELIDRTKQIIQGVDESMEKIYAREIEEIGSTGTFLTMPSTLKACRERWSPDLSDWWTYDHWLKKGSPELLKTAGDRYREILGRPKERFLDESREKAVREYIRKISS